ncbi:MAG: cyanophycinase [Peptococcaceae bacterium]|jgi:cyanophycinase|nr:cyanophycinase [Peptococcaceae bacterium]
MSEYVGGKLLIIGGAEDQEGECRILQRFVDEAGGGEARIVVLTVAAEEPEVVGKRYEALFFRLGVQDVQVINITDRAAAERVEWCERMETSSGVFFTGGDQLRITGRMGGTLLGKGLHALYDKGVVIAGTSAGASAMSDTMIVGGSAGSPKKDRLTMAPGLSLLRSVVIDQHFAQRGRIGRLLEAVAQNPYVLGVGIDEDTAVLVGTQGVFQVCGSQTVSVVDASSSVITNVSESTAGDPLALTPITLHILPEGYGFDLQRRQAIPPGAR